MGKIRVALDVMGGDNAPDVELEGARKAIKEDGLHLLLVGPHDRIRDSFADFDSKDGSYEILDAPQSVGMDENPVQAVRKKKDSSLVKAAEAVENGDADVLVSAGNTGAVMVATKIKWGVQEQVERPAIATVIPTTEHEYSIMIDVGANVDCSPRQLVQFGLMGKVYSEYVLGYQEPSIGLMNLGGEARKGNKLTKETFDLFQEQPLNFYGNVEGGDVTKGTTDVIVCDGFVGNIALKISEGVAGAAYSLLKEGIKNSLRGMIGAWIMKPVFEELKQTLNPSEYGGAPLLGLNDGCIIAHGSSSPKAIKNALTQARLFVEKNCNSMIGNEIDTLKFSET